MSTKKKKKDGEYAISKITHKTPGLTKGKRYKILNFGFYQGPWLLIINDRGEEITIREADKYLIKE